MDLLFLYRTDCCQPYKLLPAGIIFNRNRYMLSLKMITFCKSTNCPTSQDLLAFQKGAKLKKENDVIEHHLEACEFCASEVKFYENFSQDEENVVSVEIPLPLFQLAEALLNNRHKETSLLNKLLIENEGLAIEKV